MSDRAVKVSSPEVRLIGTLDVRWDGVLDYLERLGATWRPSEPDVSDQAKFVEFCGRVCYRSLGTDLNPNVKKLRESNEAYMTNIITSGHGSVTEFVDFVFICTNVSRVFTHELVRHRAGTAFAQESLRYVRLSEDVRYWNPSVIEDDPWARDFFADKWDTMLQWQKELSEHYEIDDGDFSEKKILTSAFRRLMGDGVATTIIFKVNVRELRHIMSMRTSTHAEEEFAIVAGMMADLAIGEAPELFLDVSVIRPERRPDIPQYVVEHQKI